MKADLSMVMRTAELNDIIETYMSEDLDMMTDEQLNFNIRIDYSCDKASEDRA